jgi:hypothetical protein
MAALLTASAVEAARGNDCCKLRGEYPTYESDYRFVDAIETELKKRNALKS